MELPSCSVPIPSLRIVILVIEVQDIIYQSYLDNELFGMTFTFRSIALDVVNHFLNTDWVL